MANTKKKNKPLPAAFISIGEVEGRLMAAVFLKHKIKVHKLRRGRKTPERAILDWVEEYSDRRTAKVVAAGLPCLADAGRIGEKLWLKLDVAPHIFSKKKSIKNIEDLKRTCYRVKSRYYGDNRPRIRMVSRRRIIPSFLTGLEVYKKYATGREFDRIRGLADEFKRRRMRMIFINATAAGGGVAHMRHPMMRLYRLLGANVSWHVLKPDVRIFNITKKKFHNVLQAVASPDCVLNADDIHQYNEWIKKNADLFTPVIAKTDVVVIDDPQPSGLIPHIRRINPGARVLYRSHIQVQADLIDKKAGQQSATWDFVWQFIKLADLFISHPVPEFVPRAVPDNKLVYMPPSTDPLDGLNKPLSRAQKDYYFSVFNEHLRDTGQVQLDRSRSYVIQIARFDPSKGIFDVIESYRRLRRALRKEGAGAGKMPQLIIVGNGSVDDPEGASIYEETRQTLTLDSYADIAADIKIARLPHLDQLLNALLDDCRVAFQLSHKEGFEFKVTEALMKGRPVVAYRSGGIPLQIRHGKTGFLADAGQTGKVAKYAKKLYTNNDFYKKISREAASTVNHDYWTLNNAAKWLYLALKISDPVERGNLNLNRALSGFFR